MFWKYCGCNISHKNNLSPSNTILNLLYKQENANNNDKNQLKKRHDWAKKQEINKIFNKKPHKYKPLIIIQIRNSFTHSKKLIPSFIFIKRNTKRILWLWVLLSRATTLLSSTIQLVVVIGIICCPLSLSLSLSCIYNHFRLSHTLLLSFQHF